MLLCAAGRGKEGQGGKTGVQFPGERAVMVLEAITMFKTRGTATSHRRRVTLRRVDMQRLVIVSIQSALLEIFEAPAMPPRGSARPACGPAGVCVRANTHLLSFEVPKSPGDLHVYARLCSCTGKTSPILEHIWNVVLISMGSMLSAGSCRKGNGGDTSKKKNLAILHHQQQVTMKLSRATRYST